MVLEWLKGATGVFSAGDRGAARSPAQARPPARRVRIQEDAKAAAAARVTREKEKARKDTPRKKNQSRAPSSRLKDDFVVDKKVLGEGHYGVVRRCSPRADPSAPVRKFKSTSDAGAPEVHSTLRLGRLAVVWTTRAAHGRRAVGISSTT